MTIFDAMVACGVDNAIRFNGDTAAERIATEIFDNDFMSCLDKDVSELEDDFKTYSGLTVNQGQIRLHPGTKRHIKAFIQWTKDQYRTGLDPSLTEFPIAETANLIRRHKSHLAFCEKSKRVSDTAKPPKLEETTKWLDWCPVFINFLKSLPGRHGVLLSYVVRENDDAIIVPDTDILKDYVNRSPLTREAFAADASEVHTYIVSFTSENSTAENKLMPHLLLNNGRRDYRSLKDHYEGVGANATLITKAEKDIESLFYAGEKNHICGGKNSKLASQ